MRKISLGFTAAALALVPLVAAADVAPVRKTANKATAAGQAAGAPGQADATFMTKAAGDSMAEVDHGRLAVDKAASADVKSFGQMMIDDHSKANTELAGLASQKGVSLPTDLPAEHKAAHDRLARLSGADFDRTYMSHMVQAHEKAVNLFQTESKNGRDADARAWAAKTLPTLQQHLTRAREIAGSVGASGHKH